MTARDLFVPGGAFERVERSRADLRAALALQPPILDSIGGRTTPYRPVANDGRVRVPEAIWRPLPVFQSYFGYTPLLDELNAATLPGRSPRSGSCESASRSGSEAVRRRPTVSAGTVVRVRSPRPREFLTMRVHCPNDGLLARIRAVLWRSEAWYIRQDLAPIRRLVPSTADDGLRLAVPMEIEMHPDFAFGPPVDSIRVEAGKLGTASASLTYEFWSVPLAAS